MIQDIQARYKVRNLIRYHLVNREIAMTHEQLVKKTALDPGHLERIISGEIPSPSVLEAMLIARALGERVEDVFILVDN